MLLSVLTTTLLAEEKPFAAEMTAMIETFRKENKTVGNGLIAAAFEAQFHLGRHNRRNFHPPITWALAATFQKGPTGGLAFQRAFSARLTRDLTQDQIVAAYLSRVYLGPNCFGVEAASQAYFQTSAAQLDLQQAALLAALLPGPSSFLRAHDRWKAHANKVLDNMLEMGTASENDVRDARLMQADPLPKPKECEK